MHARSDIRPDHGQRLVLGAQAALVALGAAAVAAALGAAAGSVHRDVRAAHDVDVLGAHLTYPAVNAAAVVLLLLAAAGAAVVATAIVSVWRQARATRRFIRDAAASATLPGHPHVLVFDDPGPYAFCIGFLRPRVYVSSGAVTMLPPEELTAVISHEERHRTARDPLRMAVGRALARALFFVPALPPVNDRYLALAERQADSAAVAAAGGDPSPLAGALLRFESSTPPGATGISPDRVDALLGAPVPIRLPLVPIALSAGVASLLVVLVWRASTVASVDATLSLPVLSSQPCVLVLAFVALVAGVTGITARR